LPPAVASDAPASEIYEILKDWGDLTRHPLVKDCARWVRRIAEASTLRESPETVLRWLNRFWNQPQLFK